MRHIRQRDTRAHDWMIKAIAERDTAKAEVAGLLAALKALRHVAVWDDDADRDEFDKALAMADAAIKAAEGH